MNIPFFTKHVDKTTMERLSDVEQRLVALTNRVTGLELENESLRNKVLRKVQKQTTGRVWSVPPVTNK